MLEKIARIQDKIGTLVKDTKAYNYKYVDLNQILEKLTPLLREEGLVLTQPIADGSVWTLINEIDTKDGEINGLKSCIKLPDNLDPQKLGSAITYYRRYTLVSLLALTAEDDDGLKASEGLNTKEFAQIRDAYANENIVPQIERWELMNLEQKKIINQIKLTKKNAKNTN
jgi:hypothetical protein